MSEEEDEVQPLITNPRHELRRRKTSYFYELARKKFVSSPTRTVIVEPLVALAAVALLPFMQLYQEYIYQRMLKQKAGENGINVTTDSIDSKSNCLQHHNETSANGTEYDLIESAQAATANFLIYLIVSGAVPACIVTPLFSAYSDKKGRRYAIIPPMVGNVGKTLVYLLTVVFEWPLWSLIIAGVVTNFVGDYSTMQSACFAYISDTTTRKKRAFRVTIMLSCVMMAMIVSPLVFGYLVREVGFFYPFLIIFIMQAIGLLYAVFLVPETVANPLPTVFWSMSHIKDIIGVFTYDREPKGRRGQLWILLLTGTVASIILAGDMEIFALFQMNKPLCWDSVLLGYFLAASMAVSGVGLVLGVRCMKSCLPDLIISLVSACVFVLQNVYTGFVKTTTMMYLGKLFGGIASVDRIGQLVGGIVFNLIYSKTLYITSGFVFFVLAGIGTINALLYLIFIIYIKVAGQECRFLVVERRTSVVTFSDPPETIPDTAKNSVTSDC